MKRIHSLADEQLMVV